MENQDGGHLQAGAKVNVSRQLVAASDDVRSSRNSPCHRKLSSLVKNGFEDCTPPHPVTTVQVLMSSKSKPTLKSPVAMACGAVGPGLIGWKVLAQPLHIWRCMGTWSFVSWDEAAGASGVTLHD